MIGYIIGGLIIVGTFIYNYIKGQAAEALITNLDTKTQAATIQTAINTDQSQLDAQAKQRADEAAALAAQTASPVTQTTLLDFVNKKKDS